MSEYLETAILLSILENDEEATEQNIAKLKMTEAANLATAAKYMGGLCDEHWRKLHASPNPQRIRQ